MANWTTIRRETGLIEHVCQHGTGHPSAGSIQYMEWLYGKNGRLAATDPEKSYETVPDTPYENSSWGSHGCDGCCLDSNFPGGATNAIAHTISLYRSHRPEMLEALKRDHFHLYWGVLAALREAVPE